MNSVSYKGFTITARTFQIRGSGRWTLDLLIRRQTAHRASTRAYSNTKTFPTEDAAVQGCCDYGRRIIDGKIPEYSVDDLL